MKPMPEICRRLSLVAIAALLTVSVRADEQKSLFTRYDVLVEYHASKRYEHEVKKVFREAEDFLNVRTKGLSGDGDREERKVSDRTDSKMDSDHPQGKTAADASERRPGDGDGQQSALKGPGARTRLAVVMDIDETCLSNWPQLLRHRFENLKEGWNSWVSERRASAIQPALDFYREARKHGVAVFFVTGRPRSQEKDTAENLKSQGFVEWNTLIMRPDDYADKSIAPFKTGARKEIEAAGYTIIANIGDQASDLDGGYAERTFKLPNPFYKLP